MNKNVKIAKELVKLAKSLMSSDEGWYDEVELSDIEWIISDKEIKKYGDEEKAIKELHLPSECTVYIEYDEDNSVMDQINKALEEEYKHTCYDCEYNIVL